MDNKYGDWVEIGTVKGGGQASGSIVYREGDESKKRFFRKRLNKYGEHYSLQQIERFRREISVLKSLAHPNILRVEADDLESDPPYLVTEYCALGHLSKENIAQLSLLERLEIFLAICRGVGAAHSHTPPIVHRDIKPENILLRDGTTPVVSDFGICFLSSEDQGGQLTLTDERVGNKFCRPPEFELSQPDIDEIKPASDVYCLGKLLYWLMSNGNELRREEHKEPRFDLTKDTGDAAVLFVYDLLDKIIIKASSNRLEDASAVARETKIIINRIKMKAHAIGLSIPQHCIYCGIGEYRTVVNPYLAPQNQQ